MQAGIKQIWYRLRINLGEVVCAECGSNNVIVRGFEGVNRRYDCKDCGTLIYVS